MKIEAYWDLNSLSQIKSVKGAAQAFEEEFLHIYLKEVRKEFKNSEFFGKSLSNRFYWDMFDREIAREIAQSGTLGIKEYIQEALQKYEKNG